MNEIVLKQWNAEDLSFHKDIKVAFSQCTPDMKMSWAEILRFTTDNAGEDFTQRGMSWEFLQEKGLVIIVSRISFRVVKMPVAQQIIRLNTWEAAAQGPLCTRDFEIVDAVTGEKLVYAQSLWTILDFKNKKLMPAKAYPYRPTPMNPSPFDGLKPAKISIPEDMEVLGKHKILYSELDANGHTNNSRYINFALDYIPAEYQTKELKDFRLNYSKEAHLGDELVIKGKYIPEENKYLIQGLVEEASSFECELYY